MDKKFKEKLKEELKKQLEDNYKVMNTLNHLIRDDLRKMKLL